MDNALRDWEEFLMAFQNCVKMRKVDFSDNGLGDKGIETLVRVYTRQIRDPNVDDDAGLLDEPMSPSMSNQSMQSDDDDFVMLENSSEYALSRSSSLASSALIKSNRQMSDDVVIPNRGLRSIAYIHLNNVGMTDLSALHLTYLLPYHHLPHVLLRRLDAQIADSTSNIQEDILYDPDSLCRGVMYDTDEEISPLGKKILEMVEKVRRAGGMKAPPPAIAPSLHSVSVPPSPDSPRGRRNSDSSRGYFPETPSPSRKESISSIRTAATSHGRRGSLASMSPLKTALDMPPHWTDVTKLRPKLQGEIIKSDGTLQVSQLWSAGIKLLSLARLFTIKPKPPARKERRRSTRNVPPSPVSVGSVKEPTCIGGLSKALWLDILLLVADEDGVLAINQAIGIMNWASDRASLAREREWAGKLPHVQMWKLLDVSLFKRRLTVGFGLLGL